MKTTYKVGDKVAYSAKFLRSIGCYTGDMPQARGVITALGEISRGGTVIATIEWDRAGDCPEKVNVANLARVGSSAMYAC